MSTPDPPPLDVDVAVVGAGAAGLLAALAAAGALDEDGAFRRPQPGGPRVLLRDGRDPPGRKILISGGGRCNVTNARVTEADFVGGAPRIVRAILREFPPGAVRTLFASRGVELVEEPLGKLFPATGKARTVLDALLGAVHEAGIACAFGGPVTTVARDGAGWVLDGDVRARRIVIATGGRSLPKTGCTGLGYEVATGLGHRLAPTLPALTPLVGSTRPALAGVTVPVTLSVADADGRVARRTSGSALFTHTGLTGPAALDASQAVAEAQQAGREVRVTADFWGAAAPGGPFGGAATTKPPGACLALPLRPAEPAEVERILLAAAAQSPRQPLGGVLTRRLPRRLVAALVEDPGVPLAHLTREARRGAAVAVTRTELPLTGTAGYDRAEVTAGGVDLTELRRRTLESRLAPGIHFCGEVCDATGRLGGFNFQWAWSSGYVAGRGAALRGTE